MNQRDLGVLVIDDEPIVLRSIGMVLTHLGYTNIHQAASMLDARGLLLAHRFDLIISDIALPDGDGRQLLREALAMNHGARAILISGFMYRGLMIPKDLYGKVELLAKPFNMEELSGLLAENCPAAR
jgi:two-component system catabolic regulation response regulator CreB